MIDFTYNKYEEKNNIEFFQNETNGLTESQLKAQQASQHIVQTTITSNSTTPPTATSPPKDNSVDVLVFLKSLGTPVPPNITKLLSVNSNDFSLSNFTDADNNYMFNIIQNLINQKNLLIDDIKLIIINTYKTNNTIFNLYNNSAKTQSLINLLISAYSSNVKKYNILLNLFPVAKVNPVLNKLIFLKDFNMITIDISMIEQLAILLKNIESIGPVLMSLNTYYNKLSTNIKIQINNAFQDFSSNKFDITPLTKILEIQTRLKNILNINLIKPFFNTQCNLSNKDCSIFYNNFILGLGQNGFNKKEQDWFLNANVKSRLINMLNINYSSLNGVIQFWNNINNIDSNTLENIKLYKNSIDSNIKNKIILQIFKEFFTPHFNNMINAIHNLPLINLSNSTNDQEIINGFPNLYLYIGIAVVIVIILIVVLKKKKISDE